MRTSRRLLALLALAGLLTLGACGDDAETTSISGSGTSESDEPSAGGATLTIEGTAFGDVTAAAGAKVSVTNKDSFPHTVTADDKSFEAELDPNGSASFDAPAEPGTYAFHCNIHSTMKGELVVE